MKTQNKKKIIVSTLALAMGAALAGSISGSVAWYQYSTRAAAQIAGTSAGTMGRLRIATSASGDYTDTLDLGAGNFKPISITRDASSGAVTKYLDHPIYQVEQLPELDSEHPSYIDYSLYFKYEKNSANPEDWTSVSKSIYLSYFEIVNLSANDITDAVRVEFIGTHNFLFGKDENGVTTATKGALDLNNNTRNDTDFWDCQDNEAVAAVAGTPLGLNEAAANGVTYYTRAATTAPAGYHNDGNYIYLKVNSVPAEHAADVYYPLTTEGVDGGTELEYTNGQDEYDTDAHDDALVTVDDSNAYDLETGNEDRVLISTGAKLTVRVWLEGWTLLNGASTASWTKDYIAQNFKINMQFACTADR